MDDIAKVLGIKLKALKQTENQAVIIDDYFNSQGGEFGKGDGRTQKRKGTPKASVHHMND